MTHTICMSEVTRKFCRKKSCSIFSHSSQNFLFYLADNLFIFFPFFSLTFSYTCVCRQHRKLNDNETALPQYLFAVTKCKEWNDIGVKNKKHKEREIIWMDLLMCIKHRVIKHGCLCPFEGYSPALVVCVRHSRWVNFLSYKTNTHTHIHTAQFAPFICKLIEKKNSFSLIHAHMHLLHHLNCYDYDWIKIGKWKIDVVSLDLQGPIFVHEPPYKVEFSNNTGGHIHCSGHANPFPEVIFKFIFFKYIHICQANFQELIEIYFLNWFSLFFVLYFSE